MPILKSPSVGAIYDGWAQAPVDPYQSQLIKRAMDSVLTKPPAEKAPPMNINDMHYRKDVLHYRLRWGQATSIFSFLETHYDSATNKVIVFIVKGSDTVVLEDGGDMYPSDALITQIRLLK